MAAVKKVTTHDFVQHTSKYLKLCEEQGSLIITHRDTPRIRLMPIKTKTLDDLRGLLDDIKIHGDINEHVIEGFDKW